MRVRQFAFSGRSTTVNKFRSTPNEIFPPPWEDEWYDRLLRLPLCLHLIEDKPGWCFRHPVPISLYLPDPLSDIGRISSLFVGLKPILLFPHLIRPGWDHERDVPPEESFEALQLSHATAILLQTPLFSTTPPYDSDSWNQAVLHSNLQYVTAAHQDTATTGGEEIPLDEVFVELSPLEKVGWHLVDKPNQPFEMLRAVYLSRRGTWRMRIWLQQGPRLVGTPHFSVRFHYERQRFEFDFEDSWHPVTDHPYIAKGLFVTLMLLRDLSPEVKPSPFPIRSIHGSIKGKPHWEFEIGVTRDIAKLSRISEFRTGWMYYHMRYRHNDAAYCGYVDSRNFEREGTVGFGAKKAFSRLSLDEVRAAMNS